MAQTCHEASLPDWKIAKPVLQAFIEYRRSSNYRRLHLLERPKYPRMMRQLQVKTMPDCGINHPALLVDRKW